VAVVTTVADQAELAAAAAARITALIEAAIAARNTAVVCLTGGSTPERLYALLADERQPWRARIDWQRLQVFWGDERHVPPDHPDSNFGMAHRAMLSRVPIPAENIHRMRAEYPDPREAARAYALELRPFDVMLLGLGEDAHIASIFPGSPLLDRGPQGHVPRGAGVDGPPSVAAVWAEHLHAWRITLTPPVVLAAPAILMLVAGAAKANAVRAALTLADDVAKYPAQLLRRAGDRVEWFIDGAAAPPPAEPLAR
jgi:6-phosphogluconolactonase